MLTRNEILCLVPHNVSIYQRLAFASVLIFSLYSTPLPAPVQGAGRPATPDRQPSTPGPVAPPGPSGPTGTPAPPPIKEAPSVQPALDKSASVGTAGAALGSDHLNANNRQAFQSAVNDAAMGHAALLQDAQSGKYDNKDLPKILTLMGLLASSPQGSPKNDSSSGGGSGRVASTPTIETPTSPSPFSAAQAPENSVSPNEAVDILLSGLGGGNNTSAAAQPAPSSEIVSPATMAQASQPMVAVVGVPQDPQLEALGDSNGKNGTPDKSGLGFDDAKGPSGKTTSAQSSPGAGQNLVQQVFGNASSQQNNKPGPLTEAFLKAKAKELIAKQLAKNKAKPATTRKELSEQALLERVKSDPAAYNRLVDKMAANLEEKLQADRASVESLIGPVPTEAELAALGNGVRELPAKLRGLASRSMSKASEESSFPTTLVALLTAVSTAAYFLFFKSRNRRRPIAQEDLSIRYPAPARRDEDTKEAS